MSARGGGWVVAQFVLLFLVLVAVLVPPGWPDDARRWLALAGGVCAIAGALVVAWAARSMGRALTPFPEPAPEGELVVHGPFAHVRHPIYAGGLLFVTGWSLFAGPVALALTALLALVWVGKIAAEERRLRARYEGYAAYAARVRWRLVPGVY